ncbi:MAG: SprB repeat-containing protein [Cytophagia bacterium]|nr:SprB repeat-containing protein [Cytophagia bacterium]
MRTTSSYSTNMVLSLLILFCISSCTWDQMSPEVECSTTLVQLELLISNNTACGDSNGSFSVRASGGEGPYTYTSNELGNNGDGVFENVAAGNYTVLATDGFGCSAELNIAVQNEEGVNLQNLAVTDAGCGTSNGSIQVTATGGTEPYEFRINGGVAQTSNHFQNLGSGSYTVSITDQSGCETTENVEILSGISYQGSIRTIIETKCAISGCHNGNIFPDFRSLSNIQANAGRIRTRTGNQSMPPNSSLSQQEIDMIACWVTDGALDN